MRYQSFLRKSTYWRYGIFILTIFFSYYSIQAIINNNTIDASIDEVKQTNENIRQEISRKNNFYKNYLEWEYAPFFLGHENGQLYSRERIVRLKERKIDEEILLPDVEVVENLNELTPQESRNRFIQRRLTPLIELWIIENDL